MELLLIGTEWSKGSCCAAPSWPYISFPKTLAMQRQVCGTAAVSPMLLLPSQVLSANVNVTVSSMLPSLLVPYPTCCSCVLLPMMSPIQVCTAYGAVDVAVVLTSPSFLSCCCRQANPSLCRCRCYFFCIATILLTPYCLKKAKFLSLPLVSSCCCLADALPPLQR